MVRVINITPEYEEILPFLFPTYAISDSQVISRNAIIHKNIASKAERERLDLFYTDVVIISSQIFDEVWDEDKIKAECIEFARTHFKSRKKTITTSPETFIEDCKNFIFGIPSLEDNANVLELFDAFGSTAFLTKYCNLLSHLSPQQIFASMTTFLKKIKKDSSNPYYKKKGIVLEDKINSNMYRALASYTQYTDKTGLKDCKFFIDLTRK